MHITFDIALKMPSRQSMFESPRNFPCTTRCFFFILFNVDGRISLFAMRVSAINNYQFHLFVWTPAIV